MTGTDPTKIRGDAGISLLDAAKRIAVELQEAYSFPIIEAVTNGAQASGIGEDAEASWAFARAFILTLINREDPQLDALWDDDAEAGAMKVRVASLVPISTQADLEAQALDAARYRWLRSRDLSTIIKGGVFAGLTPDNVVLAGEDLDAAIELCRIITPGEGEASG